MFSLQNAEDADERSLSYLANQHLIWQISTTVSLEGIFFLSCPFFLYRVACTVYSFNVWTLLLWVHLAFLLWQWVPLNTEHLQLCIFLGTLLMSENRTDVHRLLLFFFSESNDNMDCHERVCMMGLCHDMSRITFRVFYEHFPNMRS